MHRCRGHTMQRFSCRGHAEVMQTSRGHAEVMQRLCRGHAKVVQRCRGADVEVLSRGGAGTEVQSRDADEVVQKWRYKVQRC